MRTISKKTATCELCHDTFEWTTRSSPFCRPCRRVDKYKKQYMKRKARGVKVRDPLEDDPLPQVDWVMERQFSSFFDLVHTRYSDLTAHGD